MIANINDVYTCCGLFIVFKIGFLLTKIYQEFVFTIKADVIVKDDLDCYRCIDNGF